MESAGVIAHYVMDGDQPPLMADSAGNTAFYLYGLGAIGEKTTDRIASRLARKCWV